MRYLVALLLTATAVLAANPMVLTIEQSTNNMSSWQEVIVTSDMIANGKLVDTGTSVSGKFYRMKIVQATPTPTPTPNPSPTLAMVTVEGGTMPSPSGLAGQSVARFAIGQYEVTWDEWRSVLPYAVANGYDIGQNLQGLGRGSAGNHPVRFVNWYEVVKWCNAKSEMDGLTPVYQVDGGIYKVANLEPTVVPQANGYRLPTELEWEWAARGGVNTSGYTYSGSNDLNTVGWAYFNSSGSLENLKDGRGTWPVGQKQPNELGIYDMSGNVSEWCFNRFSDLYVDRRFRGGNWSTTVTMCAVAFRFDEGIGTRINYYDTVGFRPVRSLGN